MSVRACRLLACLLLAAALHAGIVVTHTDKGFQFAEAAVVSLNGKDKALSIGAQPRVSGKPNSIKINGTLLKDADSGAVGLYSSSGMEYLIPLGLKNPSGEAGEIWKTSQIAYKKSEKDKVPVEVPPADFLGFLPGGAEELVRLVMDPAANRILGGKDKTFPFSMELLAATAKEFGNQPAASALERFVAQGMQDPYNQFEAGMAGLDVLERGLKYAALSAEIYPKNADHEKLRAAVRRQKDWLDRRGAVLRAFASAREWDAFILADRDFEKYHHAFPELGKRQAEALKESMSLHLKAGKERYDEKEFGAAYREYRLAGMRQPTHSDTRTRANMAWTEYSRGIAIDRQSERKRLAPGEATQIDQNITFATRFKEQKKLDEALNSVKRAETIDPFNLKVLLIKAEILGAMHETSQALQVLEQYDLRAVAEERKAGDTLRNDLLFDIESGLTELRGSIQKSWAESRFTKVRKLAERGLHLKDDDAEMFYYAGLAALALRDPEAGRQHFNRYLTVSNTLDAKQEQRAAVRRMMAGIAAAPRAEEGRPNWLSGRKLPETVFYCPSSLAFQPKIERIEANKMRVGFEWDGEKLKSIAPAFEKPENNTGEKKISFAYDDKSGQVWSVAYDNEAKPPATSDPDEMLKQSSLVLQNSVWVDPIAVQKLTGSNITLGVAGNSWFLPFVWDRIHYFKFTYDENGRVTTARELADRSGAPLNTMLEFRWDGPQLISITGYQMAGDKRGGKIYERSMNYQSGRLADEAIEVPGKSSKIIYTYQGGKLVSAKCDKDLTLDGRNRNVFFR